VAEPPGTGQVAPAANHGPAATSRKVRVGILVSVLAAGVLVAAVLWIGPSEPPSSTECSRVFQSNPPTLTPVKHLFVLVKENHAFENYFGTFPGVVGNPPSGAFPVAFNSSVTVAPFPLVGDSTPDFPHDARSDLVDYNGGENNLFVAQANASGAPAPQDAVGYYMSQQIPDYFDYARYYALGDEFFTGVLGPTNPNRVFDLSAYTGNWDADTVPPTNVTNHATVLGQLTSAGIPWYYDVTGSVTDVAPLWYPSLTSDPCSAARITSDSELSRQLASPTPPSVVYLDPENSPLYSEHPPQNVSLGEEWTAATVNAIFTSPIANSSAVLIFFDENGGFWDPVPPPDMSTGLDGFRVPFLALSPWTPANTVCSTVLDPAAVLRFIDSNWGLPFLSPRVASAGNLSCLFDFSQPPRPPLLLPTGVALGNGSDVTPSEPPEGARASFGWAGAVARYRIVPGTPVPTYEAFWPSDP
jgi:phospholipase C